MGEKVMINVRTCLLTVEEQKNFDPVRFTERLKAEGFILDSEQCPVKIKQPFERLQWDNPGPVCWVQWDWADSDSL